MGCLDRESNRQRTFYDANGEQWWCTVGHEPTYEARLFDRDALVAQLESIKLLPGQKWKVTVSDGWYVARKVSR